MPGKAWFANSQAGGERWNLEKHPEAYVGATRKGILGKERET